MLHTPRSGGGCSKEKPAGSQLVQLELNLSIDPSIQPYFNPSDNSRTDTHSCDVRWIVELFRDNLGNQPIERRTWTCTPAQNGQHCTKTSFSLIPGIYKVAVWADYVNRGCITDNFYLTDNLGAIRIPEDYAGCSDLKDAFACTQTLDLTSYKDKPISETQFLLKRPLAKIEVIATDYDKFLDKTAFEANDASGLKIRFTYACYFPTGFNTYTDKPNEAQTGIWFESSLECLSDNEARLGYDYIFVNGSESAVTANLTIVDSNGMEITSVTGIEIPIVRGKLTTIRGEFLTQAYTPGIGVDPGFDGDIEITIPD